MLQASIEDGTINPDETDILRKRNTNIKKKVSRTFKKMLTQNMARTQFSESQLPNDSLESVLRY